MKLIWKKDSNYPGSELGYEPEESILVGRISNGTNNSWYGTFWRGMGSGRLIQQGFKSRDEAIHFVEQEWQLNCISYFQE